MFGDPAGGGVEFGVGGPGLLGEPDTAAAVRHDSDGATVRSGNRVLAHRPLGVDPADAIARQLGEEHGAAGPAGQVDRRAAGGQVTHAPHTGRRVEAPDRAAGLPGPPQGPPVAADLQSVRSGIGQGQRVTPEDPAGGVQFVQRAGVLLGDPDVPRASWSIPCGALPAGNRVTPVISPRVETRRRRCCPCWVTHRFPSGPAISSWVLPSRGSGIRYSCTVPTGAPRWFGAHVFPS